MQVRKTTQVDIDRVMEVLADGRRAIATLGIDQWQAGYPFRETIEADVANGQSYVVEDGDGILATFMLTFDGEPTYDEIEGAWLTVSDSSDPRYACVHRIAVCDAARGRGVAKFAIEEALRLAFAQGAESVRIDTHPGNVVMRGLCGRMGFTECGTIYISHAGEGTPDRVAFERFCESAA